MSHYSEFFRDAAEKGCYSFQTKLLNLQYRDPAAAHEQIERSIFPLLKCASFAELYGSEFSKGSFSGEGTVLVRMARPTKANVRIDIPRELSSLKYFWGTEQHGKRGDTLLYVDNKDASFKNSFKFWNGPFTLKNPSKGIEKAYRAARRYVNEMPSSTVVLLARGALGNVDLFPGKAVMAERIKEAWFATNT